MTPQDAEQAISRELESGERLLWSGIPRQGMRLRASDAGMIPFSLIWFGFVAFWEVTAVKSRAPLIFRLWGIPFVLVGLYMVLGRFLVDAMQRTRVAYGVTDRRVIILSGIFSRGVKSLTIKTITDLTLSEKSDGTGTITFGPTHPLTRWYGTPWPGSGLDGPNFDSITRAREVYARIREVQQP